MASGQIRMTPDTMRTRAGEYRTESENVQGVIEKMDSLLETLLTEWEGAASEAYVDVVYDWSFISNPMYGSNIKKETPNKIKGLPDHAILKVIW